MRVRVGCMLRPYRETTLSRAVRGIAGAGYRATAFVGTLAGQPAFDDSTPDDDLSQLSRTMRELGLTPLTAWGGDLLSAGFETLQHRLDQAALLGLESLLIPGPWPYAEVGLKARKAAQVLRDEFEQYVTLLARLLPEAAARGLRFDVKPHGGLAGTGGGLAELITRLRPGPLSIAYDPGNVRFYEGADPAEDLPAALPFLAGICVKDHRGMRHNADFPSPGDGAVDWRRVFRQLAAGAFDGWALVEHVGGGSDPAAVDAEIARARRRVIAWAQDVGARVE